MKALIIDDERPARSEMRRLLAVHPQIEIVGEASGVEEGLKAIQKWEPEILFLDIQMQDGTGFDLLSRLGSRTPQIIFTTAFDEFAVRAFEVNALDYLLKPVDSVRLALAVERFLTPARESDGEGRGGSLTENDWVFLREEEHCWFIPVKNIILLESEGNHTRVVMDKGRALIARSISSLEERLPAKLFFRANRAQLINLSCIRGIESWFSGNLKVKLEGGSEIEISRRQAQAFRDRAAL